MSYKNFTDDDRAWRAAFDHEQPGVAIIKHANPCGIASSSGLGRRRRTARPTMRSASDAFGGVIRGNTAVSVEMRIVSTIFTEVIVAPPTRRAVGRPWRGQKNIRVLGHPSDG